MDISRRHLMGLLGAAALAPESAVARDDRPCDPPRYLGWTAARERRWPEKIGAAGFVNYYGEPFRFDVAMQVERTNLPTCAVWGAEASTLGTGSIAENLRKIRATGSSTNCHVWPTQTERELYTRIANLRDTMKAACPTPSRPAPIRFVTVGSLHSSSDVYKRADEDTRTAVLRIEGLNQIVLGDQAWRSELADQRRTSLGLSYQPVFAMVGAGLHVCELNEALWELGLAIETQGSFDGQTVSGAISTGTHGAGDQNGAICDSVEAVVLITAVPGSDGQGQWQILQLEPDPDDAITDARRFRPGREGADWRLVQDTRAFEAALVGAGTLGVIVAYIVRVRPAYFLRELRVGRAWSEVRKNLVERATVPATGFSRDGWRYELVLSPNRIHNTEEFTCTEVYRDAWTYDLDYLSSQREIPQKWVGWVARGVNLGGSLGDTISQSAGQALVQGQRLGAFADRCYRVLKLGQGEYVQAWGCEYMLPAERAVEVLDWVLEDNERQGSLRRGKPRLSRLINPFGVRFCTGRRGWLSPTRRYSGSKPGLTCTIELTDAVKGRLVPNLGERPNGKPAAKEIVEGWAERFVERFGSDARLHWGQLQGNYGEAQLRQGWPAEDIERWTDAFCTFNAFGLFDNAWAHRLGFTKIRDAGRPPVQYQGM
jgi:hypothetical protein